MHLYAAIDLGSNAIRFKVVQYTQSKIEILEDITKDISLGDDVYEHLYIKNETVKEIIGIFKFLRNLWMNIRSKTIELLARAL